MGLLEKHKKVTLTLTQDIRLLSFNIAKVDMTAPQLKSSCVLKNLLYFINFKLNH